MRGVPTGSSQSDGSRTEVQKTETKEVKSLSPQGLKRTVLTNKKQSTSGGAVKSVSRIADSSINMLAEVGISQNASKREKKNHSKERKS